MENRTEDPQRAVIGASEFPGLMPGTSTLGQEASATSDSLRKTDGPGSGAMAVKANPVADLSGPPTARRETDVKPRLSPPVVPDAMLVTGAVLPVSPKSLPSHALNRAQGSDGQIKQLDGPFDQLRPRRQPAVTEAATSPGHRSVQFARHASSGIQTDAVTPSEAAPYEGLEDNPTVRDRKGSTLLSKLRALAVPSNLHGHGRSQSGYTIGGDSIEDTLPSEPLSPEQERGVFHQPGMLEGMEEVEGEEDNDADVDLVESSSNDEAISSGRRDRKRRSGPRSNEGAQTAPTTPKAPKYHNNRSGRLPSPDPTTMDSHQPPFLRRRATMTDIPEDRRAGVSEDEGRERLRKESSWRRPSFWSKTSTHGTPDGRRPSNFRRLTAFGMGSEHTTTGSPPSRWRVSELNQTLNASRWKALKAGLKLMGPKRKDEHKVDHAKSAELLAELTAGTPAALILASMFQRDDHGHKRIPVLLEQLKVRITDSKKPDSKTSSDRHQIFRIELEYGSGITRMKWTVHRNLRDFTNLHVRYKLQTGSEKYKHLYGRDDATRAKIPRFPRTAFPFLRGARGFGSDDEDDAEDVADEETGPSGNEDPASTGEKRPKKRKKRPSLIDSRRGSAPGRITNSASDSNTGAGQGAGTASNINTNKKEPYPERQRKKLELYLQQLIRHLMFRADSTRLCKFLELSSLGIRLAAEGSYHGKEGFLVIQSAKGLDFRKALRPSFFTKRHAPKWFLVRHSYIVCIDSPEEMNIYDVFLVDPDFTVKSKRGRLRDKKPKEIAISAKQSATRAQHHSLKVRNSERRLKLLAKNERQLAQFEESIKIMVRDTIWSKPHRFDSFAPVRSGVFAQWLVDGRDYMWNVSRAINMARDVIYIHDWWLSPELYMRRPAAISRKWRLDRLLQRKAVEGVKIFVIVYRNINSAVPIDSSYTKFSLLDLHPNVFVQRSPNQFRQNTFFWAHHEKICIVDHTVAFVGGIDLCFGRWDTPQHTVCDDKLTGFEQSDLPKDADHCQLWPGKDYSNPRVQDFYALDKPYEEMYDRTQVPRMPWHDISMQIVGQPARDLTRHFVQRWNYVLRQRKPTRPTPFLLPPPDFNPADLEALGLDGTCEVQILRSCAMWSIGTPDKTEHSIMNAYVKMIEQSDHFVYIENQFFISSCEVEGTKIENLIGDALVERAARAFRNGEEWRAIIVIPLMPGFQNTVDSQDGTSVRLIMQCQYRSICRGESSIFGRLRAQYIEPEDYIQFYSLRSWGNIGPSKVLVTEQLYIHAKCMVVDDRIAIIGSANINERSMLGSRDSECAAIIRDTDMLQSSMNGNPYLVGRFPHTLRMRLMREHLGVDVDEAMEEEREYELSHKGDGENAEGEPLHPYSGQKAEISGRSPKAAPGLRSKIQEDLVAKSEKMFSFNHDIDWEQANNPNLRSDKRLTEDKRVTGNAEHKKDVEGKGLDHMLDEHDVLVDRGRDTTVVGGEREVLIVDIDSEGKGALTAPKAGALSDVPSELPTYEEGQSLPDNKALPGISSQQTADADVRRSLQSSTLPYNEKSEVEKSSLPNQTTDSFSELVSSIISDMSRPTCDKGCMKDPLSDSFFHDIWHVVAENNTKLFRYVFRCMPDNEVKNWKEYKEYAAYAERFAQAQGGVKSKTRTMQETPGKSGPPGFASPAEKLATLAPIGEVVDGVEEKIGKVFHRTPSKKHEPLAMGNVAEWAEEANRVQAEREAVRMDAEKTQEPNQSPAAGEEAVDEKSALKMKMADAPSTVAGTEEATLTEKSTRRNSSPPSNVTEELSKASNSQRRRRRAMTRSSRREFLASDDLMEKDDAEELMKMVQGHLVLWPYDWSVILSEETITVSEVADFSCLNSRLEREEQGGNWLYSIDQLAPLEI